MAVAKKKHWFHSMTDAQKKAYLAKHPTSKFGKAGKLKPEAKKTAGYKKAAAKAIARSKANGSIERAKRMVKIKGERDYLKAQIKKLLNERADTIGHSRRARIDYQIDKLKEQLASLVKKKK